MKKTAKFLLPLILTLLIIASIVWYLFVYDRAFTRDTLLNQARYQDVSGNARLSSVFYDAAYKFSGHDENVAIELANQYKHDGNYTKAELTLTVTATSQYHFMFSCPSGAATVLTLTGITGKTGDYTLAAGKTYEVDVWAGIALFTEIEVTAV